MNNVDKVIYFEIEPKEALWRIFHREDNQREDETTNAIRKRIELFFRFTEPVVEFYKKQGKLVKIDATQSIEAVNQEILKNLGKQLVRNKIKDWRKKEKTVIAIVGLPGAGKSEAANFFKAKDIPVVSFGQVINDYIDKNNLCHDEQTHRKLREKFRKDFGKEAFAVLNLSKIKEALKKNLIIVIDGMRSWEEYIYLKKNLKGVKIVILAIYADKDLRYKRISSRGYRNLLGGEERDINELIGTNMGPTIAFADYLVKNNFSLEEFYDKLEEVFRQIYFG